MLQSLPDKATNKCSNKIFAGLIYPNGFLSSKMKLSRAFLGEHIEIELVKKLLDRSTYSSC